MNSIAIQGLDTQRAVPRSQWLFLGACTIENGPFLKGDIAKQKEICGLCRVREMCLKYALANDEKYGVWGGLSRPERLRELKNHPQEYQLEQVPLEYRDHYKELEGRVKRRSGNLVSTPVRNPALDYVIEQSFLDLLSTIDDA